MPTEELREDADRYLMQTYTRQPISIVRGRGSRVFDLEGREYVDFVAGVVVNVLGHGHPDLIAAIQNSRSTCCMPQTCITPSPRLSWRKP